VEYCDACRCAEQQGQEQGWGQEQGEQLRGGWKGVHEEAAAVAAATDGDYLSPNKHATSIPRMPVLVLLGSGLSLRPLHAQAPEEGGEEATFVGSLLRDEAWKDHIMS
jgi:hypothetical protein